MGEYNLNPFYEGLKEINVNLTDVQVQQFVQYYETLIKWNEVMNLTAITEFDEVVSKHFVDSLSLSKYLDLEKVQSLIDVGTGAGFPGIPLAIAFPHLQVTLLDSLMKRVKFLNEVIEVLHLTNVKAYQGRAEDFGRNPEFREKYDLVVSRAVTNLTSLCEYCLPFVRVGGEFAAYKSNKGEEELAQARKAISILKGKTESVEHFTLPETDQERCFIIIKKIGNCPKAYPRKAGTPTRKPLI